MLTCFGSLSPHTINLNPPNRFPIFDILFEVIRDLSQTIEFTLIQGDAKRGLSQQTQTLDDGQSTFENRTIMICTHIYNSRKR